MGSDSGRDECHVINLISFFLFLSHVYQYEKDILGVISVN